MPQVTPFRGSRLTETVALGEQINQGRERNRLQELASQRQDRALGLQEESLGLRRQQLTNEQALQKQTQLLQVIAAAGGDKTQALGLIQQLPQVFSPDEVQKISQMPEEQFQGLLGFANQVLGNEEDFGKTLIRVKDDQGNERFAQASGSGGIRFVDDATPPGPTELESQLQQANVLKAQEQATQAQLATQTQQNQAEAAAATQQQIRGAAASLLGPDGKGLADGVSAVFGSFQGAFPSARAGVVDAEAEVDRLIALLTVENLDKMKGVLSDKDIQILRDAGTVLANKRISDTKALQELQSISGVLERNAGAFITKGSGPAKVGRFTVEVVQ